LTSDPKQSPGLTRFTQVPFCPSRLQDLFCIIPSLLKINCNSFTKCYIDISLRSFHNLCRLCHFHCSGLRISFPAVITLLSDIILPRFSPSLGVGPEGGPFRIFRHTLVLVLLFPPWGLTSSLFGEFSPKRRSLSALFRPEPSLCDWAPNPPLLAPGCNLGFRFCASLSVSFDEHFRPRSSRLRPIRSVGALQLGGVYTGLHSLRPRGPVAPSYALFSVFLRQRLARRPFTVRTKQRSYQAPHPGSLRYQRTRCNALTTQRGIPPTLIFGGAVERPYTRHRTPARTLCV